MKYYKSIKYLKEIIQQNNFNELLELYKEPYFLYQNNKNNSEVSIQLFHFKENIYILDYLLYINQVNNTQIIKKQLFFRVENNINIPIYAFISNNHFYFEGVTYDF